MVVEHPLGSELWAYVPYNLLPHLQWLGKADYPHVYYMDGPVKSYDVNIFSRPILPSWRLGHHYCCRYAFRWWRFYS